MIIVTRASLWLAASAGLLAATACSGPTISGFSLTEFPANVGLTPGSSSVITISTSTKVSSPITAAVVLYNLPQGVTYTPASPTITTGSQTNIVLTAASNAPVSSKMVQVVAYTGLASSAAPVSVSVSAGQ